MSRNDWERGEFKLPSAEYAAFRQAMQDIDKARKEKAFAITQDFWKGLTRKQQTDTVAYQAAVREWDNKHYAAQPQPSFGYGSYRQPDPMQESARSLAHDTLYSKGHPRHVMVDGRWQQEPNHKPSRVLAADMDYPTNRTTSFGDRECSVSFDKDTKTVTWHSGENNHAVNTARETPLGRAFYKRLGEVRWTHGTGGTIVGNDENNQDSTYDGGGANYCTGAYGYLGMTENPMQARDFVNAKGEQITCEIKSSKYGLVGKPVKVGPGRVGHGIPSGGQFSTRGRSESGIRL